MEIYIRYICEYFNINLIYISNHYNNNIRNKKKIKMEYKRKMENESLYIILKFSN